MIKPFDIFLTITFIVRTSLLILTILHTRAVRKNNKNAKKLEKYKEILGYVFNILMGVILIYLFNVFNKKKVCVNNREKIFLFLFGIFSIVTSMQS